MEGEVWDLEREVLGPMYWYMKISYDGTSSSCIIKVPRQPITSAPVIRLQGTLVKTPGPNGSGLEREPQ